MGERPVWGVSMFRDEADVAFGTICHMAEEGLAGIVVADNRSTDATRAELERAAAAVSGSCAVHIVDDPEVGYYQSPKMSGLANQAAGLGAHWIVPFDADELWYSRGGHLASVLEALPSHARTVSAVLHDHYPTAIDPPGANPFETIQWRMREKGRLPKVAFQWAEGAVIGQGNHSVTFPGRQGHAYERANIEVRHFPYRTLEQFRRKARNGAEAYRSTDLPMSEGAHWRQYGALLEQRGEEALDEVFRRWFWFLAPVQAGMVLDPAPYRRWTTGEPAPPAETEQG